MHRWVFYDPYDMNVATNTYTVPINPNAMTSPFPKRTYTTKATTAIDGQVLIFEGQAVPASWQFYGDVLDARHYDLLRSWVYDRNHRIQITDHYGRVITCVLDEFNVVPKRAVNVYWRGTYTITGLVISLTRPTLVAA